MTPLATQSIGINEEIGLEQVVKIWRFEVNAKVERIYVSYEVETLSPTGIVLSTTNGCFERYNGDENKQFDALRDSQIGQAITGMLANDLKNFPNFEQK